jgi:predicted MFS family arabinose efflux permease
VAGGFGTYLGGRLADRYGYELVLTAALALTLPAVALIELSPSPVLAFPAAALAGIAVVGGYTSTVVLGQRMLPRRETFAAGMTLGFAMGRRPHHRHARPLADAAGPQAALWISGALATLALPAALKIGGHRLFAGRPSATAAG